jgi:carbon-monoxide dehydrogenase small subunit
MSTALQSTPQHAAGSEPVRSVTVTVNGVAHTRTVPERLLLSDFLRHELGFTGTHVGCEHGVCGACTVLIDGFSGRSCLTLAVQADGASIETVEGLAKNHALTPLQQAFWDHHGLQCGFCTPGILMSLTELLRTNADPTEVEVRDVLSGHLCRCTGYQNIVTAALAAAAKLRESGGA